MYPLLQELSLVHRLFFSLRTANFLCFFGGPRASTSQRNALLSFLQGSYTQTQLLELLRGTLEMIANLVLFDERWSDGGLFYEARVTL